MTHLLTHFLTQGYLITNFFLFCRTISNQGSKNGPVGPFLAFRNGLVKCGTVVRVMKQLSGREYSNDVNHLPLHDGKPQNPEQRSGRECYMTIVR